MNLVSSGLKFLLVALLLSNVAQAQRFTASPAAFVGGGKVVFADFNNDGHLDLFVCNGNFLAPHSAIYKNDGAGNFTLANSTLPGVPFGSVDIEDFNHDGQVDLLLAGASTSFLGGETYLMQNTGNFTFTAIPSAASGIPNIYSGYARFGDFDNDGSPDVLARTSGSVSDLGYVVYQNKAGVFSSAGIGSGFYQEPYDQPWIDYDNDGDNDFVTVDSQYERLTIMNNDGFDRLSKTNVDLGYIASSIKWVNINNDNLPDLLVNGHENSQEFFQVFINQGNHSFGKLNQSIPGFSNGEVMPIDIDNDGDTDLLIAGHKEYGDEKFINAVYINTNGVFTMSATQFAELEDVYIATADVDHDNDLDVVISGHIPDGQLINGRTYLYLNTGTEKNSKPSAPSSLTAVVDGQRAMISWTGGFDQQTPANALTYNVYVGTASSVYNVIGPLATANGVKANRPGNAGSNLSRIVDNLAPGTYYYRVQTVDGAQGVSDLSQEKQFVISAQPPVITDVSPAVAHAGDTIYVTGRNFRNASAVSINDIPATYKVTSSSTIRIIVPSVKWSGKIKITTPLGTGTSTNDFCEIPVKVNISGETQPCFGDVKYKLSPYTVGLNYVWSVDNGATVVGQSADEVTIRFPAYGKYNVSVYPESCDKGEVTAITVDARGARPQTIIGDREVFTEVRKQYNISTQGVSGETYTWAIDNVVKSTGTAVGALFTDEGNHQVKLSVASTTCPASIFEVTADVHATLNQYSFKYNTIDMDAALPTATLIADLDGDGDDDLLESNRIRENVNGVLVLRAPYTSISPLNAITPFDIDNDNDIDLLIKTGYAVKLLRNDGALSFTQTWSSDVEYSYGVWAGAIDFDLDGKTDLANNTKIYRNNVNGFTDPQELLTMTRGAATTIDHNRDGYPDLLTSDGQVQLNGGDVSSKFYRDFSYSVDQIYMSDLDGDGLPDYITTSAGVRFSNGTSKSITTFGYNDQFMVVDANLDGFMDVIVTRNVGTMIEGWLYDPATDSFKNGFGFDVPYEVRPPFAFDLDNDGVQELLFLFPAQRPYLMVYKTNSAQPAIAVPSGLKSAVDRSPAELSWDKVAGYTYNVVVGSSIGANDVVSPLANLTTGDGLIRSSKGNAGFNNFFKVNLAPGTYYWSVQGINGNGSRSKFSEWQSFTIDTPTSSLPANIKLSVEQQGIAISWDDNTANETGFVIERRSDVTQDFVALTTVGPNVTQYVDLDATTDAELQYRITALIAPSTKLHSKPASSLFAVVHKFPYKLTFENPVTIPAWTTAPTSQIDIFDVEEPMATWYRGPVSFPLDPNNNKWNIINTSFVQAFVSPDFNLSEMENAVFKFELNTPRSYYEAKQIGEFELRVEQSTDGGQTWTGSFGMVSFDRFFPFSKYWATFHAYALPKSSSVRFRVRSRRTNFSYTYDTDFASDNYMVVDGPSIMSDPTLTQTAQNEVKVQWTPVPRATRYYIHRNDGTQSTVLGLIADTPTHSYFDKTAVTSKTYKYFILAYDETIDETSRYYNPGNSSITVVDIPFSLQSIDPTTIQATERKEIPLTIFPGATPLNDVDIIVTSSNPQIQNLSVVRTATSATLVIQADTYQGQSTITITASHDGTSDTKTFDLTIAPVVPAPTGPGQQRLCYYKLFSDLNVTGSNIKWYAAATGGSPIDQNSNPSPQNNTHYFASQTIDGLESFSRLEVAVTVGVPAPTGSADQQVCTNSTIAELQATGSMIKWYTGSSGGSALNTTTLITLSKYYASQTVDGCESQTRLAVNVSRTAPGPSTEYSQTVCGGATIANLNATGNDIKWYTSYSGGLPLSPATLLVNNKTYYASQTVNGCESADRSQSTVTVKPVLGVPVGSVTQTLCPGSTIANLVASGSSIKWYDALTGGSSLAPTLALQDGSHYYASQTSGNCESSRLHVVVTLKETAAPTGQTTQDFCTGATISSLVATGSSIKWYRSTTDTSPLQAAEPLQNGSHYYATQSLNNCESASRLDVVVSIHEGSTVAPTGNNTQTFCDGAILSDFSATGTAIKWYDVSTGGIALPSTTLLLNNVHYYASQTANGCESNSRLDVKATITPTPGAPMGNADQQFDPGARIEDLFVPGTSIKWYSNFIDATSHKNPLPARTVLDTDTYYATQTVGNCESEPFAVSVTIHGLVSGLLPSAEPLTVYPNPTTSELTITNNSTINRIVIVNSIGQDVLVRDVYDTTVTLNVSDLAAGFYLVRVIGKENILLSRVVKL